MTCGSDREYDAIATESKKVYLGSDCRDDDKRREGKRQ